MRRVVIVGGGAMGSATAHFLLAEPGEPLDVTIIERDPSYRQASSALSAAGIRQQFSTPANIALSLFSARFLREAHDHLKVGEDRPEMGLREDGYLVLASSQGAAVLRANHEVQVAHGAVNTLLDAAGLQARFPWLATDGLALGCLGLKHEGWFDAYGLFQAFRRKARSAGATYLEADAVRFIRNGTRIVAVETATGERIAGDVFVLATGAWSASLARSADVDLPVRARRRTVFSFACREAVPSCPLVVDPSGVWFRPEGNGQFIGGISPDDDPDDLPLEPNHAEWEGVVWPALATRVPAFEAVKVTGAWAGYYEYNTLDQNGIIGPHDVIGNLVFATGFSGHGVQQSPGVGRAMAEWIRHGAFQSIDVGVLGYGRIPRNQPVRELNII